ncbi:protein-glutamate methylesterase/protein-glutamine glutaminase [Mediterraneibacter agrestimuris]|uniref:protein-glutamate methylesterase/protein-glutamine glutaminase n=1 Tax=Mediterraneibacter agrestimuris TaxID=2941333 RepID=UPI002F40F7C6
MLKKKISVLSVDDSPLFRKMIIDYLSTCPDIEVVGYAVNAYDARHKIPLLKPDVITLDVEMPGMNGIEFLKELLPVHPIPVILVSSLNLSVFDALSAGAVDFVRKPDMTAHSKDIFFAALYTKIHIASMAHVRQSSLTAGRPSAPPAAAVTPVQKTPAPMPAGLPLSYRSTVIALGASTGGTEATLEVLRQLPANIPGMVITQHMPEGFTDMYAQRLNRLCQMEVREAKNGDQIRPGLALIAPGALQMEVIPSSGGYAVRCFPGEKVSGHRPSVDVLFRSVAKNVTGNKIGIIMTGMGKDGAEGLLEMHKKGAFTIGQDKASCVVYGMPMVAFNIGAVSIQASCDKISAVLLNHLKKLV